MRPSMDLVYRQPPFRAQKAGLEHAPRLGEAVCILLTSGTRTPMIQHGLWLFF